MNRDEKTKLCVRSIRFKEDEIAWLDAEMKRQDRSLTWLIRQALLLARPNLEKRATMHNPERGRKR